MRITVPRAIVVPALIYIYIEIEITRQNASHYLVAS